jgi:membrane-associated phospholipid phosphatase
VQSLLNSGAEFIVWLQQFQTPLSTEVFEIITGLGGFGYLYMIPFAIWCVDYRAGLRLLALFSISVFINTTLKTWIAQPRPFQLDPRVMSRGEDGYGLPSGHAQFVVVYWGVLAHWVARPWFWALCVLLMAAIGFSRIYLGVHFPSDVIAGWALGAATLWAFAAYGERALAALRRPDLGARIGMSLAIGAALFVADVLLVGDAERLNAGAAGFIAGAGVGAAIAAQRIDFDAHGPWWQRALRYLVGMAVMLLMLGAMRAFGFPTGFAGKVVIALDLAALGLWLSLGAPWLFQRTRLATPSASAPSSQSGV